MKRATGVLSGSDRNLGGPGKSRHFGDSGSGTHSQRRGSADRPPDPRRAQSRRTATHPRPSCPQNTSGPPRCPARRTWSGRRRLRDDRRITGEDHRRKPTARSPNSKKPSTPVLASTRTPSSTSPSPDSPNVLGARTLAECSRFDPNRYTSAKSPRNYAGTSPITIASGRKHAVVARHVRKASSLRRSGQIGGSVP